MLDCQQSAAMQYGKSYIKGKKIQHSMPFNSSDFAKVQTYESK